LLGVLERLDEFHIVEDLFGLRLCELPEDGCLGFLYGFTVAGEVHHVVVFLLLDLGAFLLDHVGEELLLQALECHGEVDDCDFYEYLWQVLWVGYLGG
jgi:hypothetical protein